MFRFLTYIQPTRYFALTRNTGTFVYPIAEELPESIKSQLQEDSNYKNSLSTAYDLSWTAIKLGYIGDAPTYKKAERLPVVDEYRFIRKHFHPIWSVYVLLLRLITFKNPFKELTGWWKTKEVKKGNQMNHPITYKQWEGFQSKLIEQSPLVSVVIPTLNRYDYLQDVLRDFEKQTYTQFEIVVVDQSQPYREDFYKDFKLNINLVRQEEPALWLARNTAVQKANGTIIALSEDDVRIDPDWIENHLKCLDFFDAEISAGVFFPEGSTIPKDRSFFAVAPQFATGNAALYKEVFEKIGLFDRQFERQRMGDGEFGLRSFLYGIKSVSTPYACCIDVKAATGGLRQMGSWDAFRPKKWFSPRPIPSVLYLYRKYYGTKRTYLSLLKTIPPSIIPYRFKKNKKMLVMGGIISVFLMPIILIQVIISWRLASKKLKQGALIGELQ